MAEDTEGIDNGEVRSSNNELGPVLNLNSEPLDCRCPFYKDSKWFISPQRKRGRCTSCDGRLFEVPNCETGNQYLLEDHCNASLWRLKQVLDERVRQQESQCVELNGPHEQTCPLVEVGQLLEQGLFDTEDLSANDEVSQQAGPQDDNRGPNPVPMKYCTQKCMFGLKRRLELDSGCPNVTAHRQGKNTNSHQIDNLQLASLLTTQLALDRNNGCTLLKLGALPGRIHAEDKHVIFRLTLISHGYTFIGKATQMSSVMKLKREKEAYLVLRKMQGEKVPVLLGDLYFAKPWSLRPEAIRLSSGSEMVYMLLLSYAGNRLMHYEKHDHRDEIRRFRKVDMRGKGLKLELDNINSRNVLWNDERGRLMFIDFERVDFSRKWTAVINDSVAKEELLGCEQIAFCADKAS